MNTRKRIEVTEARLISLDEAANLCRIRPGTFRKWVRDGLMPDAWRNTNRYDLRAIHLAIDKGSCIVSTGESTGEDDDFAQWMKSEGYE